MAPYHYPPGPKPRRIFGNLMEFRKDQLGFMTNLQRTYGDAATMYFFKSPAVLSGFTRSSGGSAPASWKSASAPATRKCSPPAASRKLTPKASCASARR